MPIEQVQLGQRLVGANPLTEDVELDEPDPAFARTVVLEATERVYLVGSSSTLGHNTKESKGGKEVFKTLFNKYVKTPVRRNPNKLRRIGWPE